MIKDGGSVMRDRSGLRFGRVTSCPAPRVSWRAGGREEAHFAPSGVREDQIRQPSGAIRQALQANSVAPSVTEERTPNWAPSRGLSQKKTYQYSVRARTFCVPPSPPAFLPSENFHLYFCKTYNHLLFAKTPQMSMSAVYFFISSSAWFFLSSSSYAPVDTNQFLQID